MTDTDPSWVSLDDDNFALEDDSAAIGAGEVVPYWQQQDAGAVDIGA